LKMELFDFVQSRMDHIYSLLVEIPKLNTRKCSWWSKGWSWVTGLATDEDVQAVHKTLDTVSAGMTEVAQAWESGSGEFVAAMELEKKCMDNLYKLLEMRYSSFEDFHSKVLEFIKDSTVHERMLGYNLVAMKEFVFQVVEVSGVYEGILDLLAGRLSHFIIDHDQLRNSLEWLQWQLDANHTDLVVLRQDPRFYFERSEFKIWSYNKFLVINLKIPVSTRILQNPFILYSVYPIPLASPTKQRDHYTQLVTGIKGIVYNQDSDYYILVHDLHSVDRDVINLQTSELVLRDRHRMTCGLALLEGSLRQIKELCEYVIVTNPLPTEVYKIDQHTVLVSN